MQGCLLNQMLIRDFHSPQNIQAEYLLSVLLTLAEDKLGEMSAEDFQERFGKFGTHVLARYWTR